MNDKNNTWYCGLYILILLIPYQLYFTFYKTLSVSIAQIFAGLLFIYMMWQQRSEIFRPSVLLDWAVMLFIFAMFASIFVSDDKINSSKYFIKWASFTLLYYITAFSVKDETIFKRSLQVFGISAAALALIGIFEYIEGRERVIQWFSHNILARIIIEPDTLKDKLASGHINWLIWNGRITGLRAFGTFDDVIDFSAYLGMIIPFGIYLLRSNKKYLPFLGAVLTALFLTFTRSAYLSFACSAIATVFFLKEFGKYRSWFLKGTLVCILICGALLISGPVRETVAFRFNKPVIDQFDRKDLWKNGVKIFYANPLIGVGIANYHNGLLNYAGKDVVMLPAHNEFIQIAAETGLFGLISYLSIIVIAFWYSYVVFKNTDSRDMKYASLGFLGLWVWYFLQSNFSSDLFGDKFSMMFWLMVGLNAALHRIHVSGKSIHSNICLNEPVK